VRVTDFACLIKRTESANLLYASAIPIHPLFGDPLPMTAITWQQRIDCSHSEEEVVEAAREFLASFTPDEIASLPAPCRPPAKLVDRDDVSRYAFDLVRHECETPAALDLVHKLARFFSHAATRLTHIASRRYLERSHLSRPADEPKSA
jgi:hypothetical protein